MWIIIDGKERIKVNTFEEGIEILQDRLEDGKNVRLLAKEEFKRINGQVCKRGKKSLKKK